MNFLINFMVNGSGIASETETVSRTSGATQSTGLSGMLPMLVIFGIFFVILYFFSIRPNKKRQKEHKQKMENLKKGDKIQTIGGWRGVVCDIKEKVVIVRIDDNAKIEVVKEAISDVLTATDEKPAKQQESIEKKPQDSKDEQS